MSHVMCGYQLLYLLFLYRLRSSSRGRLARCSPPPRQADLHWLVLLHQRLHRPVSLRPQTETHAGCTRRETLYRSRPPLCHACHPGNSQWQWRCRWRSCWNEDPERNIEDWWQSRQIHHSGVVCTSPRISCHLLSHQDVAGHVAATQLTCFQGP
jgi:hypothetical protein